MSHDRNDSNIPSDDLELRSRRESAEKNLLFLLEQQGNCLEDDTKEIVKRHLGKIADHSYNWNWVFMAEEIIQRAQEEVREWDAVENSVPWDDDADLDRHNDLADCWEQALTGVRNAYSDS